MMRRLCMYVLIVAAALIPSAYAMADCDNPISDAERDACLASELIQSDKDINQKYQEIMSRLTQDEKTKLRNTQRQWLKDRDATCIINTKESDRKKWMAYILKDYKRTVCVVRFTNRRVNELNAMKQSLNSSDKPDSNTKPDSKTKEEAAAANDSDLYDIHSKAVHNTGKWYFEVKIDMRAIADMAESVMFIGVATPETNTGWMPYMRKKMQSLAVTNYGIGADLDNGKVYLRINGSWQGGTPGSSQGLDIKTGRNATAIITSSVAMGDFINNKLININLGSKPFEYALPDGYKPFEEK
ncbi:MAG: lysozyme inhibitor LprI family protein [Candidatus Magnetominusculus sp. LBB02]|nr:lysozyme inhibitor LprI family protein [Candidatus Magnetominusculus sp. LBB02]